MEKKFSAVSKKFSLAEQLSAGAVIYDVETGERLLELVLLYFVDLPGLPHERSSRSYFVEYDKAVIDFKQKNGIRFGTQWALTDGKGTFYPLVVHSQVGNPDETGAME